MDTYRGCKVPGCVLLTTLSRRSHLYEHILAHYLISFIGSMNQTHPAGIVTGDSRCKFKGR